jgi:hypothetical protein
MILSGDYEFLSPFWDNISQSAKVHSCSFFCFCILLHTICTLLPGEWNMVGCINSKTIVIFHHKMDEFHFRLVYISLCCFIGFPPCSLHFYHAC